MTGPIDQMIARVLVERPEVTDLHLAVGEPVRLRACGELSVLREAVLAEGELTALVGMLSPSALRGAARRSDLQQWLAGRDGGSVDFAGVLGTADTRVRLRGNLHLRAGGSLGLVLRRLRDTIPGLDALGLPPLLARLVDRSRGLLLVTGPTGSGKSTTLASLVRHLVGTRALHVLTIEDPIEYRVDAAADVPDGAIVGRVTTREIGTDTPDFAGAVSAALRQDPDVIVIGEIRDRATMHAALAAAETGHLVLATLHTPNASEAVERVLSFFAPDEMPWARSVFATVLVAVVAQALVRKRGERALTLACELMVNTPAVRQQILQGTTGQLRGIMAQGRRDGHLQMAVQLADRVRRGEIEEDDARYVAHPVEEFDYLMHPAMPGRVP